jgi:hypothetical protein
MNGRWDFSQYNTAVKWVELCADSLRQCEEHIAPVENGSRIVRRMRKHLLQAAIELDKRALRMLAMYDPAAQEMVRDGVKYDPRRDMFRKSQSAHAPEPLALHPPKRAPKTKKVSL